MSAESGQATIERGGNRATVPAVWMAVAVTLILVAVAWAAGQLVTSTLAEYDDEGYVMISLASHLQGRPLYSQTYTQYGPAYYQLESTLHRAAGWPVTHDVTRFKTLGVWIAASTLCGLIVWRLTRHPWLAIATLLAAACHLDKLSLEPGHPQEVCLLGFLVALLAATWIDFAPRRSNLAAAAVLGIAAGVVIMTKINVGGLLALAAAAAILLHAAPARWSRAATAGVVALMLVAPSLLCRQCWTQGFALALPLLVTLSTAIVCWWTEQQRFDHRVGRTLAAVILASSLVCLASAAWCLAEGTTLSSLFYGLVGQHIGFDRSFYHSAPVYWPAVALAVAIGAMLPQVRRDPPRFTRLATGIAVFVGVGLVGGFVMATGHVMQSGLELRGCSSWLLSFGPLVAWAIVGPRDDGRSVAATLLALVACLLPLMSYPTPGTQVELGTLPLLIVVFVLLAHRWPIAAHEDREADTSSAPRATWLRQPAVWFALALLLVTLDRDVRWTLRRSSYTPLALPGASWLRLPDSQARQQQQLVASLQRNGASTFVFAEHGQNRFYFWTQRQPPNGFNATFWPYMLSERQQLAVVERLRDDSRVCVVSLRQGEALLPKHRPLPLREYLVGQFRPVEQVAGWEVWRRSSASSEVRAVDASRPAVDDAH